MQRIANADSQLNTRFYACIRKSVSMNEKQSQSQTEFGEDKFFESEYKQQPLC